jgi:NitT/TauT family transport system permease protein
LSFVGFFVLWELAADLKLIPTLFYSSPIRVLAAGIEEVQRQRFWQDVRISLFEFAVGYVLAVVLGIPLGLILGWYRRAAYLFEPIVNFFYAVPRFALLPLIVLWLGLTVWSKVAVVFLGAFITILISTFHGARRSDPRLQLVALTFGASQRKLYTSVVLPGSIPYILAGLRLGTSRAIIGVVVGELYAADEGLGNMINRASNNLQADRVLFATILLIMVSVLTIEATRRVEKRYSGWRVDTYAHN